MQYRITWFLLAFKFRFIRVIQRHVIFNLFTRLKVTKDIFFSSNNLFNDLVDDDDSFDYKRLQFVFSLRNHLILKNQLKSYRVVRKGLCKVFFIPTLFDFAYQVMWNISFVPFVESFSDRFAYVFRPFRNHVDFLIMLKNKLSSNFSEFLWNMDIQIFPIFSSFSFFKSLFIERIVFESWLKNVCFSDSSDFFSPKCSIIYYSLVNYLLSKLVWTIKLN